ncbi:hypothetical protein LTR09_003997 [Extremus antarcticus]|uniref:CUE domain-containing protein n=1 Tax=Extremus antarcticus TaxID=702011 RepID=A0AAJ0GAU1_9PEZI|nr:hypothetical protein LTR09_003997 [Extremus antarcticus]
MASLPPLADIPPPSIRLSIAPEEWEACLESWLTLAGLYLQRPVKELTSLTSTTSFLQSFYHESAQAETIDGSLRSPTALRLRKACFLLTKRTLQESTRGSDPLEFDFIGDFCRIHARNVSLPSLIKDIYQLQDRIFQKALEKKKASLLMVLDSAPGDGTLDDLRKVADLIHVSPEAATLFMTGSDFVDSLASQYQKSSSQEHHRILVGTAYFGLLALVRVEPPSVSLLSDHLYSLKAQADDSQGSPSLLGDLVTNTSLTKNLRRSVGTSGARLSKLLDTVDTYRTPSIAQPRRHGQRNKGKGKAVQLNGEMHMHRLSLVTQVQDLFPDLGSGFVLKLLDEYNDDVEHVTTHLLDDSLPPHLQLVDRKEQADVFDTSEQAKIEALAPQSTPPLQPFIPERRNVFDDDEFDRLELDTRKLHLGKMDRNQNQTSDQPNKAAILSALAAFDSDDDERDDTYDVEDVGGTVDAAHPDGEPGPNARVTQEENEMALFTAYKSSPQLFGRTFDIRRGQARQALKAETGMSDEQIEGWAVVLQRDPRRLKRLEGQGAFDGGQASLGRSAYRESPAGTETEDSDAPADRGGFRGRGRGRGGRGRGGSVAGPSSEPGTANAQRRKEASKGSRANHNRRDQRAKKMARGGFPG